MRPMLDDLELPQVQEVRTIEVRALAEHKAPGFAGSHLQNLGRRPLVIGLWGIASGPEARTFLDRLEAKVREARPVPFTADIVRDAGLERVAIQALEIEKRAGVPDAYAYLLTLAEFQEPLAPAAAASAAVDDALAAEAARLMGDLTAGLELGDLFANGLTQFVEPLTSLLGRVRQFGSDRGGTA